MTDEILKQMAAYVSDKQYAQSDWKRDIDALQFRVEPFFWSVRENGTVLDFIGGSIEWTLEDNECYRMMCMKDIYTPIAWTLGSLYVSNPTVILYWDGNELRQISQDEIKPIFKELWEERMKQLRYEYPDEWKMRNKPIDVEVSDPSKEEFERVKKMAEGLGDESFMEAVNQFKSWVRMSANHKIVIYRDTYDNSFYFEEKLNDEARLNGGIIYYPEATANRWHLHT